MRYKRSYFFVLPFLALGFLVMVRSAEGDVVEEVSTKQEGAVVVEEVKQEVENMEVEEQMMLASESLGDLRLELGRTLLLQGGLEVKLLKRSRRCHRKVVAGDLVAIQYEGRLEGEDGEIFHATELRQPFVFVVSAGAALPGLVAGVQGMCKGEVRSLHLPANLAWGEKPPSPLLANCSVHYKVELEMIQEGKFLPIPTPVVTRPVEEVCYVRGDILACRGLP